MARVSVALHPAASQLLWAGSARALFREAVGDGRKKGGKPTQSTHCGGCGGADSGGGEGKHSQVERGRAQLPVIG
jgi:hypothetical protein